MRIASRPRLVRYCGELIAIVFATASFQEGDRSVVFHTDGLLQTRSVRRCRDQRSFFLSALASARQTRQSPKLRLRDAVSVRLAARRKCAWRQSAFPKKLSLSRLSPAEALPRSGNRTARPALCSGSVWKPLRACGGLAPGARDLASSPADEDEAGLDRRGLHVTLPRADGGGARLAVAPRRMPPIALEAEEEIGRSNLEARRRARSRTLRQDRLHCRGCTSLHDARRRGRRRSNRRSGPHRR